jgi:hypothetical protein
MVWTEFLHIPDASRDPIDSTILLAFGRHPGFGMPYSPAGGGKEISPLNVHKEPIIRIHGYPISICYADVVKPFDQGIHTVFTADLISMPHSRHDESIEWLDVRFTDGVPTSLETRTSKGHHSSADLAIALPFEQKAVSPGSLREFMEDRSIEQLVITPGVYRAFGHDLLCPASIVLSPPSPAE